MTQHPTAVDITVTRKMAEAFDKGMPVVLLPPGYDLDRLLSLLIDVVLKGSADRLMIMPTQKTPSGPLGTESRGHG